MMPPALTRLLLVLPIALGLMTFAESDANARRGLVIITYGEDVMHVQDLPDDVRVDIEAETENGVALGYQYSAIGVFWLDLWRWGGKYVLYHDDTVWTVDDDQLCEIMHVDSVD